MPTELSRERTGFFHAANRALTRADQNIYNTTINSSGLDKDQAQLYKSFVPFTNLQSEVDTWIAQNPNFINKQDKVSLTELAGSNGQTWFITVNGERALPLLTEQFLVDLSTNTVPNAYVFELYDSAGTRIPPTTGDWWVVPDEGLVRFEAGSTPADMGWGVPQVTCYVGSLNNGRWRVYHDDNVFYIDHYHSASGEWKPHIQVLDDNIRMRGTILADLNSFQLGDIHKISSGGEQIVFQNLELDIITTPIGGAVTKHLKEDYGASAQVYNNPATKVYGEIEVFDGGPPDTSAEMDYEFLVSNKDNSSTFGIQFIPAEDYTGPLSFDQYYAEGEPDDVDFDPVSMKLFRAELAEAVLKTDVPYVWFFDKPSTTVGYDGSPLQIRRWGSVSVQTNREVPLKVRPSLYSPTGRPFPAAKGWVRGFSYKFVTLSDTPDITEGGAGSGDSGGTEWLFAEESRMDSLHLNNLLALAGKDGNLVVFDPFSDERGAVEFEQYRIDNLPTLHEAGTHFALADNSGNSLFFSTLGLHKSEDLSFTAQVFSYTSVGVEFTYPMEVDRAELLLNGNLYNVSINSTEVSGTGIKHIGVASGTSDSHMYHGREENVLDLRVYESPNTTGFIEQRAFALGFDTPPTYNGPLAYDQWTRVSQVGQVIRADFSWTIIGGSILFYYGRTVPNSDPTEYYPANLTIEIPPAFYGAPLPMFFITVQSVSSHSSINNMFRVVIESGGVYKTTYYNIIPSTNTNTYQFVWTGSSYNYHIVN